MKLNRTLTINQVKRQLVDERVVLDLYSPGRAQFTLVRDKDVITLNQLVTFDMGYASQPKLQRWFIGVVDKVVAMGEKRVKVFCRELSSALSHPLPLNLRHVNMREVVADINNVTGLNFATPDKNYSTKKVANFFNLGSGYQAMETMARVFSIPDFIWQQQSGVVYIGSWADSRWAGIKNMLLPLTLFNGESANESANIAAIPQLRPGMRINHQRITNIEFSQNNMVLSWKK